MVRAGNAAKERDFCDEAVWIAGDLRFGGCGGIGGAGSAGGVEYAESCGELLKACRWAGGAAEGWAAAAGSEGGGRAARDVLAHRRAWEWRSAGTGIGLCCGEERLAGSCV